MDFLLSPSRKGLRRREGVGGDALVGQSLVGSSPHPPPPADVPPRSLSPPLPSSAAVASGSPSRSSSSLSRSSPCGSIPGGASSAACSVSPRRKLASSVDFLMDRPNDSKVPVDLYRDSVVAEKNRYWRSRCWSEIWRLQDALGSEGGCGAVEDADRRRRRAELVELLAAFERRDRWEQTAFCRVDWREFYLEMGQRAPQGLMQQPGLALLPMRPRDLAAWTLVLALVMAMFTYIIQRSL